MAARATFALKAGLCVRRARLAIVAPDLRHSRRSQADFPLIGLSEFGQPPLSEALALTVDRVDLAAGVLVIESLKKRRTGVYRVVPVPPALLEALDMVHGIRER